MLNLSWLQRRNILACSAAAKLDALWINAGLLLKRGVASAGLDAQLPRDDWMMFMRLFDFQRIV